MPDSALCLQVGCSIARNCARSPESGTVANFYRQVIGGFNTLPSNTACPGYASLMNKRYPDLADAIWAATDYFVSISNSSLVKQITPDEAYDYMRNAYRQVIALDIDDLLAQDIQDWFRTNVECDTAEEVMKQHILAVTSMLDTHYEHGSYYADKLTDRLEKIRPKLRVVAGNSTVN